MNRILLIFIILLFITITVIISVFKPKTHKHIVFEDRNFKIELISDEMASANIKKSSVNLNINKPSVTIETPKININLPEYNNKTINKIENKPNKPQQTQNKAQNKAQNKTQIVAKNKLATKDDKLVKKETKTENNHSKNEDEKSVEVTKKNTEIKENKILTEEEEIIAWNKWRSDLQNKLMKESKMSAPIGTSFEFSFTVDKFGNISNLKTWSSNPSYTPLAVNIIKPLLLSYQKTTILKFPDGSKRVITNVNGGFTMARSSRYSSPSDYNDYERVIK